MQVIGHRGAAARAVENTVAAVTWAFDHGADGVEIDVRRTGDGVLVCSHDPSYARFGGPPAPIVSLAWAELSGVAVGGEPVATVTAVLDAAAGRGRVVLEVKNLPGEPDFDAPVERTAALLAGLLAERRAAGRTDDVVVSSFNWFAVEVARDSGVRTAFLTPPGVTVDAGLGYAAENGHAECHPHFSAVLADPDAVDRVHGAGLAVVCWTVGSPDVAALAAAGVDGVIGDDPAALRAALAASG